MLIIVMNMVFIRLEFLTCTNFAPIHPPIKEPIPITNASINATLPPNINHNSAVKFPIKFNGLVIIVALYIGKANMLVMTIVQIDPVPGPKKPL